MSETPSSPSVAKHSRTSRAEPTDFRPPLTLAGVVRFGVVEHQTLGVCPSFWAPPVAGTPVGTPVGRLLVERPTAARRRGVTGVFGAVPLGAGAGAVTDIESSL